MGFSWLINGGDEPLTSPGMILQVASRRFWENPLEAFEVSSCSRALSEEVKKATRKLTASMTFPETNSIDPVEKEIPWDSYISYHPCMVHIPTFTIKINHSCRWIYQSHGSYGYWKPPFLGAFAVSVRECNISFATFVGCHVGLRRSLTVISKLSGGVEYSLCASLFGEMIRVETTNQMISTDLNVFLGVKRHRNHGSASRTLQSDLHHPKGAQDANMFCLQTCT